MKAARPAALALLLACKVGTSADARPPDDVLSVYSNICFSLPSGDIRGVRMIVLRSGVGASSDRLFVIVQEAAGELQPPIFEEVHVTGDQIAIRIHFPHLEPLTFAGTITPQAIEGSFKDRDWRLMLPRRPKAENRFEKCT